MTMSNREYEDWYGEVVGYCRRHKISIIESCDLCEDEEESNNFEEAE
jgi:hypothetical protein